MGKMVNFKRSLLGTKSIPEALVKRSKNYNSSSCPLYGSHAILATQNVLEVIDFLKLSCKQIKLLNTINFGGGGD